jgi:transcriptional regulator with XRE-family HTH domain
MPKINDVRHLGDYIREQRDASDISLRQLAKLAGVSNPYLSQIERGLRKPSAEILQQIAKALRISAEALYVQAGILERREGGGLVPQAILADDGLSERQKQVLLEIYDSFRKENAAAAPEDVAQVAVSVVTATAGLPDDLTAAAGKALTASPSRKRPSAARKAASAPKKTAARRTPARSTTARTTAVPGTTAAGTTPAAAPSTDTETAG